MPETRYRKGDRVRFRWGVTEIEGIVIEDRGPLGIKGRHLYRVEFRLGYPSDEPRFVELPAVSLQLVHDPVPAG
jgi:hypothetical protein